ncbi:hypothetical protein ACFOZ0_01645 [Streptomyces yaanensis]|uniref:Transposase n=1 Tax=Streptomyces yaanensis TaxID=1142239 RepID=A0ABV7S551_9ACTN|nr:hypothetical protein [Streptomyces sp. CGMCC 4.7035]WNB99605.1 hypothetical protein Q2K21_16865 [Streptomyces sp. CGMCC 4.7035]
MDLDAVADELYGLPPSEFIATRDERAKAARAAGDQELADRIRRLRRPTLAAWAGNLLVRERPEEARRLLRLGEALRQAHRDLDGEQLRELSAQQRHVTFTLAREAGTLTAQAGQRISEDAQREVQETLHAVLGDPEAAGEWAQGRLTKPLSAPVGFPALTRAPAAPSAARRGPKPAGRVADLDAARTRRREQRERLEQARQRAAEAERELHDREEELAAAQEEQRRVKARQQQAEQRVADLSRQLKEAESEQRQARDAARHTHEHTRDTEGAVREARRRAKDAATHARQLAEQTRRES